MTRSAGARVALAGAAVVAFVAAVVLVVRQDKETATVAIVSPTPAASFVASAAPIATRSASPLTSAYGRATSAPATRAFVPSGPVRPKTAAPPRAGFYVYKTHSASGDSTERFRVTSQGGGRQTEQTGEDQTDEVVWSSSKKLDLATTFGTPPNGFRCDWNPDFAQYVFPLAQGRSWSVRSSCHPTATTEIAITATSRVTGAERVTVGGQAVDTWVIATDATFSFKAPQGTGTDKVHYVERFAPDRGLTVRDSEQGSGTDPATGKPANTARTREIQSLEPDAQQT